MVASSCLAQVCMTHILSDTCPFSWKLENVEVTTHSFAHSFHTYVSEAYCAPALGHRQALQITQQLLGRMGKECATVKVYEGPPGELGVEVPCAASPPPQELGHTLFHR